MLYKPVEWAGPWFQYVRVSPTRWNVLEPMANAGPQVMWDERISENEPSVFQPLLVGVPYVLTSGTPLHKAFKKKWHNNEIRGREKLTLLLSCQCFQGAWSAVYNGSVATSYAILMPFRRARPTWRMEITFELVQYFTASLEMILRRHIWPQSTCRSMGALDSWRQRFP